MFILTWGKILPKTIPNGQEKLSLDTGLLGNIHFLKYIFSLMFSFYIICILIFWDHKNNEDIIIKSLC